MERERKREETTSSEFINPLELIKRRFDLLPLTDHSLYLESQKVCEIKWIQGDFGERNTRECCSDKQTNGCPCFNSAGFQCKC